MPDDIGRALDSLPGWVIPVTVGGVVLIALFSKSGGGGGGGYNTVVYGPTPVDPGLISLQENEVNAKAGLYNTAINAFISRDIAGMQNERDVALGHINESIENTRTRAAEGVALAESDNNTRATIYQAQTAGRIVDSQGATAKYLARKNAQASIWGSVLHFGESVANIFTRH